MAKFALVAVLLLVAIASSTAAPADGGLEALKFAEDNRPFEGQGMEDRAAHPRLRRALCEYNSYGGAYYDNGCNGSCQSIGRVHGTCQNGVCACSEVRVKDTAVRWG